jgi:hypothetical protein
MVATLTPPFRLGVGSETRKKAGRAVRQATDCGFCFPETRTAEFENESALRCLSIQFTSAYHLAKQKHANLTRYMHRILVHAALRVAPARKSQ